MRLFVSPFARAALITSCLLAGCGRTGDDATPAITLLRDGSERVCAAPDVRKALRGLVVPKTSELQASIKRSTRDQAVASISVSYEATTLKAFDSSVSKATCATTIALRSTKSDERGSFRIEYEVMPSADDPDGFVISAEIAEARALAEVLAGDFINDVAANAIIADQERKLQQQKAGVRAVVSDKWLRGAWIAAEADQTECATGGATWFQPGDVFEGYLGQGRWTLSGDQLRMVGGENRSFNLEGTIVRADSHSFKALLDEGGSMELRRCSREEIDALPELPSAGSADE